MSQATDILSPPPLEGGVAFLPEEQARLLEAAQRLASIVESSDDAIISKDLNGIIRSWNRGAQRVFGYTAEEVIGQSVMILIPTDFHNEEPVILGRIVKGERVDHYETVRQRKDGTRIHVSLSVSPIRDGAGTIVGASKIARDITETKLALERKNLLLREMSHRVKNLFAVASGVVSLSVRSATTPRELANTVQSRLAALARANDLTLPPSGDETEARKVHLRELVRTILSPYDTGNDRIVFDGQDIECGPAASTSFALLLHEFATNAIKYGALGDPDGRITVSWKMSDGALHLIWSENCGRTVPIEQTQGFGSILVDATIKSMDGSLSRDWHGGGLDIRLDIPLSRLLI